MGNKNCSTICLPEGSKENLYDSNIEIADEPSKDFAPYIENAHNQIPHQVNHVIRHFEKQNFKVPNDFVNGKIFKDGYYRIKDYDIDYSGEWRRGLPHGKGEIIFEDGSYFSGCFRNGVAYGPDCLLICQNGGYYRGSISENKREGYGQFIEGTYKYRGQWEQNLPHGLGEEYFPNGDYFEGTFIKGEKDGESCTYKWSNDNKQFIEYNGEFSKNYFHGKGTLLKKGPLPKQNIRIQGEFNIEGGDFKIQKAKIQFKENAFEGQLINSSPTGKLKYMVENQEQFKGQINEGRISGELSRPSQPFSAETSSEKQSFTIFQSRELISTLNFNQREIRQMLQVIEKCYDNSQKHSEALANFERQYQGKVHAKIIKKLQKQQYDQLKQSQTKFMCFEICGKIVLVFEEVSAAVSRFI